MICLIVALKIWKYQGFEIHGSTGAALPEKNYGWQKK